MDSIPRDHIEIVALTVALKAGDGLDIEVVALTVALKAGEARGRF